MNAEPAEAAAEAGLVYVSDVEPGLSRERSGKAFAYRDAKGAAIKDAATLDRIKALAIPPAWEDVWICAKPNGHLQASGRDAKGRKQHRYHPRFREVREQVKFDHLIEFARGLPALRSAVARDRRKQGLPREKVLATVVHLLDTTLIRVGNDDYAAKNGSYGLTTLLDRHAKIAGDEVRFVFTGKSGKSWNLRLKDKRIAKTVKAAQDLPGQRLFQYRDENGEPREVTSTDVNAYLREISGREITAKDFRTWSGTVLAATALNAFDAVDSEAAAKRNVREAIEQVAQRLGNTPTICRKCYVHPKLVETYLDHALALKVSKEIERTLREDLGGLSAEEAAVLAFLHKGLGKKRPGKRAAKRRAPAKGRTGRTASASPSRRASKTARPARSARG